jgi:phosphoribosylformimino-5-aminoimidazole carboxamide ribotide isomerase
MIVIPSLDVRDGVCLPEGGLIPRSSVRRDPEEVLRSLVRVGFSRFHIADLEARPVKRGRFDLTNVLLSEHAVQFQVSRPVRRSDQIDELLGAGASFVVVGPRGVDDEDWLGELITDDSRSVIIAADVQARRLRALGTQSGIARDVLDWVEALSHLALGGILIRAVDDHGQSASCDFALLEDLVESAACPVLAAGVVDTVGELDALQDRGVAGTLLGECLYTGRIDPWIAAQEFRP